jgi:hypothetical protein
MWDEVIFDDVWAVLDEWMAGIPWSFNTREDTPLNDSNGFLIDFEIVKISERTSHFFSSLYELKCSLIMRTGLPVSQYLFVLALGYRLIALAG